MPFTPFHLGPGLAFKAIGGRHFSFMVFGGSQVMMDIEPLLGIVYGWPVLHGPTHTLAGALAIGTLAGLVGRPVSEFVLARMRLGVPAFTWASSFAGAYAGTFSHLVLDALMHADMAPLRPFAAGNPWLGAVAMETVHVACVALAMLGGLVVGLRGHFPK